MVDTARKFTHIILGSLLILVGIAGLILPILNGTIFLIVGFILISFESPYVERKLQELTSKNKLLHKYYLKLDGFLRKHFGR